MAKSRNELRREMSAELYASASFFKMKTLGSQTSTLGKPLDATSIDARVNRESKAMLPMANPHASIRYFPEREKMPKFPKGR